MRRLLVLVALLLLVPSVYAQEPPSPSTSPSAAPLDKDAPYVLWDLAVGHNMLFSKVMDLLHIAKDGLFQLEIKMVETTLTDFPCDQQPVSFWIPANLNPYGKLNEIDALIQLLIQALRDGGEINFGLTSEDVDEAEAKLIFAECHIGAGSFREAFNCKCLAYREDLLDLVDNSVTCSQCTTTTTTTASSTTTTDSGQGTTTTTTTTATVSTTTTVTVSTTTTTIAALDCSILVPLTYGSTCTFFDGGCAANCLPTLNSQTGNEQCGIDLQGKCGNACCFTLCTTATAAADCPPPDVCNVGTMVSTSQGLKGFCAVANDPTGTGPTPSCCIT